jgi:hypothetical protein
VAADMPDLENGVPRTQFERRSAVWNTADPVIVGHPMTRFYFRFNNEPEDDDDERGIEFPTLNAAIVAGAASLAMTAYDSGKGKAESMVVVGDDKGPKVRVTLSVKVEKIIR